MSDNDKEETSNAQNNKLLLEALTATMTKMMGEKFEALRLERDGVRLTNENRASVQRKLLIMSQCSAITVTLLLVIIIEDKDVTEEKEIFRETTWLALSFIFLHFMELVIWIIIWNGKRK